MNRGSEHRTRVSDYNEQLHYVNTVTVAGHIGSGKTAVCRRLHALTGWEIVSAGAILRSMAVEHGMSVLEFNEYAKSHPKIDQQIDSYIRSLASQPGQRIVDSRLAWHFLPMSHKVFLVVEPTVGAARVFGATRPDESHLSIDTAAIDNAGRQRLERQRFTELYGLDCDYWRNYDLVIDTTHITPEQGADVILSSLDSRSEADSKPDVWLSPRRLMPSRAIRELVSERADDSTRIDIAVYRGFYLIVDGHARVSAAIRSGSALIRCRVVAFEQEPLYPELPLDEFARTSATESAIYDWEDVHGFQFAVYPPWLNAPCRQGLRP